jgi:glycine/D-amino acid oxidase-like deaminating enzyme
MQLALSSERLTHVRRSDQAVEGWAVSTRTGYISLWLEEALAHEDQAPRLSEPPPSRADVVIIGGGFTGLWTAIRLLEQDASLKVCLLEARYCGYGASGRNGGIAEGSWAKFPTMRKLYGDSDAAFLVRALDAGLDDLQRFCAAHGIDAQIRAQGNLWMATNQAQLGSWDKAVEAAKNAGASPFKLIGIREAQRVSSSPLALAGVFEDHAATLQPARLVRGLRRVALEMGLRLHEYTPMTGIEGARPVRVTTPAGTIHADKVVVAMNAWAASWRPLRPYLFVTSSDIIATRPVPDSLDPQGLGSGVGLSDSRRLILYWRSTPDGRIVFGKGGGHMSRGNHIDKRFTGESALLAQTTSRFRRLYPHLRDIKIQYSWNGPIDYSSTGLPYFGPLDSSHPTVFVGIGYSGMGVVQTVLGGRILASLVLGRDDDYTSLPLASRWPRKLPPEPLKSLGAPLVRAALTRKELLLDAEAAPGRLLSFVAGLDPTAAPSQSD